MSVSRTTRPPVESYKEARERGEVRANVVLQIQMQQENPRNKYTTKERRHGLCRVWAARVARTIATPVSDDPRHPGASVGLVSSLPGREHGLCCSRIGFDAQHRLSR